MESNATCDCSVEFLLASPFKSLKLDDKIAILKKGRPTPKLKIPQSSAGGSEGLSRRFHNSDYEQYGWLCGCQKRNRLYCWPCVLFGQGKGPWNNTGCTDLRNFVLNAKRHQLTPKHLISFKELKKFDKVFGNVLRSEHILSEEMKKELQLYNSKVKKNRAVFQHLIRAVANLSRSVPLGEIDEEKAVKERCYDALKFTALYDEDFNRFVLEKKDDIFSEVNLVADALADCLVREAKKEVAEAEFVSFILDGVVDAAMKCYIAVTLRFAKPNGEVAERCVELFSIDFLSSHAITEKVRKIIYGMDCASKILGFTYDGAAIRNCDFFSFNTAAIKLCHYSTFAHGSLHEICNVLIQSVSQIDKVRIFLSSLTTFYDLFSKTFMKLELLDDGFIKDIVSLKSDDKVGIMKRVYKNRIRIISQLKSMIENPRFDSVVIANLKILLRFLFDLDFTFMLLLLSSICIKCEPLSNGPVYEAKRFLRDIQHNLEYRKVNFVSFWNGLTNTVATVSGNSYIAGNKSKMELLYNNVLFTLMTVLERRYAKADRMLMYGLIDPRNFKRFHVQFPPKEHFHMLIDWHFARGISYDVLRTELVAIYSDPEFYSVFDLHGYMLYHGLEEVFPETFKLCQMLKVLPVVALPDGASQRIRNCAPQTVSRSTILSIEKNRVEELVQEEAFLERVLDEIASKTGKAELTYKTSLAEPESPAPEAEFPAGTAASYPSEISPMESMMVTVFDTQRPGPSRDSVQLSMTCDVQPDMPCLESQPPDERPKLEPEAGVAGESSADLLQCPVLIKEEIISSEEEL